MQLDFCWVKKAHTMPTVSSKQKPASNMNSSFVVMMLEKLFIHSQYICFHWWLSLDGLANGFAHSKFSAIMYVSECVCVVGSCFDGLLLMILSDIVRCSLIRRTMYHELNTKGNCRFHFFVVLIHFPKCEYEFCFAAFKSIYPCYKT